MNKYESINPYTQKRLERFEYHSLSAIQERLKGMQAARKSADFFKDLNIRAKAVAKMGELLLAQKEALATLITLEMGKPYAQAIAEIEKSASVCAYYSADKVLEWLQPNHLLSTNPTLLKAQIHYQPLGILLQIMPWNFPFWQVFRFAAPAMLAGNSIILKHATNVPQCALAIEKIMQEALGSEHIFINVFASNESIAELAKERAIQGFSFTGSNRTGAIIGEMAGRNLKKSVLELGGSDAFIVLEDANLKTVIDNAVQARLQNNGQTCIASKRFIVHESLYKKFVEGVAAEVKKLKIGDPFDTNNFLSVLARPDLAENLDKQINKSITKGAKVALRGGRSLYNNCAYKPAVLFDMPLDAPCAVEETFGPAFAIFKSKSDAESIEIANSSIFGLGGSVWSEDFEHAKKVALALETGAVGLNHILRSDPRLPFGGVKDSGYGCELGQEGLFEFVNIKTLNY